MMVKPQTDAVEKLRAKFSQVGLKRFKPEWKKYIENYEHGIEQISLLLMKSFKQIKRVYESVDFHREDIATQQTIEKFR